MGKIRTFLSLNLENSLKERFKRVQDSLKADLKDFPVKWENPDKFHLTLRFLGDIDENEIPGLTESLNKLQKDSRTIILKAKGIGFFPNPKYPNVVFIDLTDTGNSLVLLIEEIDKVIARFEIKPDKKFVPHITLGRFNRNKRAKINKSQNDKIDDKIEPVEIEFNSFYLMKSILKPKGSVYEIINEFKFSE